MTPSIPKVEIEPPEPLVSGPFSRKVSSGSSNYNSRDAGSSSDHSRGTSPTPDSTLGAEGDASRPGSSGNASPARRYKPELVETSTQHGGRLSHQLGIEDTGATYLSSEESSPIQQRFATTLDESSKRIELDHPSSRRFIPLLVESSRRSRRVGDNKPALTNADRTDAATAQDYFHKLRAPGEKQSALSSPAFPTTTCFISSPLALTEPRKPGNIASRRSLSGSSTPSKCVKTPALETIESSESDRSDPPSPVSSHYTSPTKYRHIPRLVESCSFKSSGRLLEVAARNAERQLHLREQALAAFPNDDRHQPVDHFIDNSATPAGSSFSSQHDMDVDRHCSTNWELQELRLHHEKLEAVRLQEREKRDARRKLRQHLDEHPWAMPVSLSKKEVVPKPTKSKATEDEERLKRGRPPMLGSDLVFPRSHSPDPARFDVTQGPDYLKKAMCYLSEQSESSCGGLWSPRKSEASSSVCVWSRPVSRAPSAGGLWGGSCIDAGSTPPQGPSGLVTPRFEEESPLWGSKEGHGLFKLPSHPQQPPHHLPPSPPPSTSGLHNHEEQLEVEQSVVTIEAEFDDHFITQVYNYMSLGYPAIARDFDEELSKVARVPIDELRQDDHLPSSRGYIRLGEDSEVGNDITEENCARWKALRVYIHEWARQQPKMAKPREMESGWVAGRKTSWAW